MEAFLTRKWKKELGYRLKKHLWAFEVFIMCSCNHSVEPSVRTTFGNINMVILLTFSHRFTSVYGERID